MPRSAIALLGLLTLAADALAADDWPQDAHEAQRTGCIAIEPQGPWKWLWSWNGPDEKGGAGGHFYDAPREARTVLGGKHIYVPAGVKGLYALEIATGKIGWHIEPELTRDREAPDGFDATPVYDAASGMLLAATTRGVILKIDAATGKFVGELQLQPKHDQALLVRQPLEPKKPIAIPVWRSLEAKIVKPLLLLTGAVIAADEPGRLHSIEIDTLRRRWTYDAHSPTATPASYSAKTNLIVFATEDLFVHAVDATSGELKWKVLPIVHDTGFLNSFAGGWPVIAEETGIVFLRMRLDHNALWSAPGPKSTFPNTNAETRAYLVANPKLQNLYTLKLTDGTHAFIPAVGYGGVEGLQNGKPFLEVGPMPVIKKLADGREVAYMLFRNGQSKPPDGRWDSHLGEMVLTDDAQPGMKAGDLRFVAFPNSSTHITDEQCPMTMAGDTIFRAHWGASESIRITDRAAERGLSFADPIRATAHPVVCRRQSPSPNFDPTTHWTRDGLTLFKDGRYWKGPGWWVYWGVLDPPTPQRNAYSDGLRPRYTYAAGGVIVVEGNGGELAVFSYEK